MNFSSDQVQFAAYLVGRMIMRVEAKRILAEKFKLDEKQAGQLLKFGRRSIKRWLKAAPERHHMESAAFYRAVVQSPDAETRDQLKARMQLDKVLGVEQMVQNQEGMELSQDQVVAAVERILERYADTPVKVANES